MSKADEMFEKLEYKKAITTFAGEEYYKIYKIDNLSKITSKEIHITFWYDDKTISKDLNAEEIEFITMEELQAINEKVKELRLEQLNNT